MDASEWPIASLSLEEKIGQMLLVGFPEGEDGLDRLRAAVSDFAAGNVILFTRNTGKPSDLFALTGEVRRIVAARTGIAPLIAIDQEGGVVVRQREGITPIPGAMAQASAVGSGRLSAVDVRALGRVCGTELRALGVNWNLAPVADVNVNPANPVIGVRSYGEDSAVVAELASAFAAGLAEGGVLATAKHFPGHGDTNVDSHLGLPLIPHDLARLEAVELVPFRRLIAEGVAAVMTAHIRFPALEAAPIPATLSPLVVRGLLREKLGFRGLVTSDCLEMRAITDNYPDAAVMAVKAGVDILDISHTLDIQRAAARAIAQAVRRGEIPESRIDESVSRIAAAKARMASPPVSWEEASRFLRRPESLDLSARFSASSLALIRGGAGIPPAAGSLYVDVVPQNASRAEDSGGERGLVSERLASLTAGGIRTMSVSEDPEDREIVSAVAAAAGRGAVVGIHDATKHPRQVELARAVAQAAQAGGRPFAIVSMRSPYDATLFPDLLAAGAAFLCAYEYTPSSARAVAERLAEGAAR